MIEARLHEGTITFGLWLIAPFGWGPEPWLTEGSVIHAARQYAHQYRKQSAFIARQLMSISPQHSRYSKRVND